jgi:hypothetical protein
MPELVKRPGVGLEADLHLFIPLKFDHGADEFLEVPNQNILRTDDLARFLAHSTRIQDRNIVIYDDVVHGKDILHTSWSVTETSLPASELAGFRRAVEAFLALTDGKPSSKALSVIRDFRLPSPAHDPDFYRLVRGPRGTRRLVVLWGCEREPGTSLPPRDAVAQLQARVKPPWRVGLERTLLFLSLLLLLLLLAWYVFPSSSKPGAGALIQNDWPSQPLGPTGTNSPESSHPPGDTPYGSGTGSIDSGSRTSVSGNPTGGDDRVSQHGGNAPRNPVFLTSEPRPGDGLPSSSRSETLPLDPNFGTGSDRRRPLRQPPNPGAGAGTAEADGTRTKKGGAAPNPHPDGRGSQLTPDVGQSPSNLKSDDIPQGGANTTTAENSSSHGAGPPDSQPMPEAPRAPKAEGVIPTVVPKGMNESRRQAQPPGSKPLIPATMMTPVAGDEELEVVYERNPADDGRSVFLDVRLSKSNAPLSVNSWKIDGVEQKKSEPRIQVSLLPGKHAIEVGAVRGGRQYRRVVELDVVSTYRLTPLPSAKP